MRKPLVGRKVTCSLCAHSTVHGTTQVCREVVFQFCTECWNHSNLECRQFMTAVRLSVLSKDETFWLINEWQPDVTYAELETMWSKRRMIQ